MPVSKRLRFEILRRDGHTCRYYGAKAPNVPLRVDHVVPVALGGSDDPSNLVAACEPCNAGKSSIAPDSPIVADVAADALRWSRAMEIAATQRQHQRHYLDAIRDEFLAQWNTWAYTSRGVERTIEIDSNWGVSIDRFIEAGLSISDLLSLIEVAMTASTRETWRYFCGCAWKRVTQAQEQARSILQLQDESADRG